MTELDVRRAGKITGSRVASVLGLDPYRSRKKLLAEMVAEAKGAEPWAGNEATAYGHEHEQDALDAFTYLTGLPVHSQQEYVPHPDHDFLAVTLDARVGRHGVVDAKAPIRATYRTLAEKPGYEAQVRLQMACAGAEYGWLVVWRPGFFEPFDNTVVLPVENDPWWLESVLPVLDKFINDYRAATA